MATFRRDGHLLVRGLLDGAAVAGMRGPLMRAVERSGRMELPPERLKDAYSRAFVQVINPGFQDPSLQPLTRSPRVGAWVAALLGAPGARLLLEDAFLKLPGAGPTPWHQDGSVAPVPPEQVLTAWIPLQPVAPEMGGLRLVPRSHRHGLWGPVDISEQTQEEFERLIALRGLRPIELPPMALGDVSFHSGCTVHGARANETDQGRLVLALHCFADGVMVAPIRHPNQAALLERLAPGHAAGDAADAPCWPRFAPAVQ